jgi:hypothetical protein
MHLQESNQIKSRLSCLRDGLNIFSNDTFFPPTDIRLRLHNLQLSSTLAFFCCLPRFFKTFSQFQSQTLINISNELSHSNSKQTIQACNYREEPELTPDWLFLTVAY